jgi:glycosyltransferase involved in cell wall biosynthesis
MESNLRIIVLEPYYGGSHRAFLEGLAATLPFSFDFHTLPARSWKWRMRLAAPYYAEMFKKAGPAGFRQPCRLLCSSYVDVAAFKALAPAWLKDVPIHTYFHENQFAYPVRIEDERDYHYALTNLTTALASDHIAFNSRYNLESFLAGSRELLKKNHDIPLVDYADEIIARADILPPGIDFGEIDAAAGAGGHEVPVIVWNHRWEHDKNPEMFFEALFELTRLGIPFGVIILGQSFSVKPDIFEKARRFLREEIVHFGYAPSREAYLSWLKQGDLVVSTARHEFYGISVIEAVRAGCRPLLPGRLSYPEIFPDQFLYEDHEFSERLRDALSKGRLERGESRDLTGRFSWRQLADRYRQWLVGMTG